MTKALNSILQHPAADDRVITGLAIDSRKIDPGMLFCALPGSQVDGAQFIAAAVQAGATAILHDAELRPSLPEGVLGLPVINPRLATAKLAARWYDRQPEHLVAITGTNGKSSIVDLFGQLARFAGLKAATIGTLGVGAGGDRAGFGLTTPDVLRFHEILADLADQGMTHVAFEASSHGLDQHRIDGASLTAAGFSNITRDHLDYHGDFESYLFAKMRLIGEVLPPRGHAVINVDAAHSDAFVDVAWARGLPLCLVGHKGRDLRIVLRQPSGWGQRARLAAGGQNYDVDVPLIGGFQLHNAVLAAGLLQACGVPWQDILPHFNRLEPVPGRLERVSDVGAPVCVVVDYAHTPDALSSALSALRPHTKGKLHVVFGCGGDRDTGKRPLMGQVANDLADSAIVTDDNPRSEDPATIRQAILAGAPNASDIGDRQAAIETAIAEAAPGDMVLIAGKGHETGQDIAGEKIPFDDRDVARGVLQPLRKGA
ncbi:MAG: UDP-N-acetylmuramoyl-L-alanyl-D-glutamate--2,6-diaminopimelate ligase [Pseudomonadota bacterium]